MIEGVKLVVTGREIQERCVERERHHGERVSFYASEMSRFEKEIERLEMVGQNTGQTTLQGLQRGHRFHKGRVEFFEFVRNHIESRGQYLLQLNDLALLEFELSTEARYY